jgi:hypothetical protein
VIADLDDEHCPGAAGDDQQDQHQARIAGQPTLVGSCVTTAAATINISAAITISRALQ